MNVNIVPTSSYSAHYWSELKDLSDNIKLELIALLSGSMVKNRKEEDDDGHWADQFCGVWDDSRSAEEIVDDIRSMRTRNTTLEEIEL